MDPREEKCFLARVIILAPWSILTTFVVGCEFAYSMILNNSPFPFTTLFSSSVTPE